MSDKNPTIPPASSVTPTDVDKGKKAALVATPTPVLTPDARSIEEKMFSRILARDDAARARAGTVTLMAIASFTRVVDDDVGLPVEEVVHAGDEFEISAHDLPRYTGRGRPKVLGDPNPAGVTISRE